VRDINSCIAKATRTAVFSDVTRCVLMELLEVKKNGDGRFLRNVCRFSSFLNIFFQLSMAYVTFFKLTDSFKGCY
jgi:hypothetical protein